MEPVVGRLVGDNTDYVRALNDSERRTESMTRNTQGHFSRLGDGIKSMAKVAAVGLAGLAVGAVALLKKSVDAAEESRKVAAQTEAVIKSTGGAANVSAEQVGRYADKLAALTGIDDEVIAGGQNMLLTFTQVRNEAGKGNDIFNQGTKAALNMSVALKQDLASSSMLVGKALNDPIAGMTALTRSGIQFTAQQKEQIKAMVAAGDVLGAQKVILKELETQFGGSAEAAASPMARLKVVVGNLQEELGARFLPVIGKVAGFLADTLPPALDAVGRGLSLLRSGFAEGNVSESTGFMGFIVNIGAGVRKLVDQFKEWWPQIKETVLDAVDTVVAFVKKNWPEIRQTIESVMKTIQSVVKGVIDIITTIWRNFGEQITDYVQRAFRAAMDIIQGAMQVIQGIIKTVTAIIHGDWSGAWEGIKQVVDGAWQVIQGLIDQAMNMMQNAISIGMEIVGGIFGGAWDAIFEFARNGVARIVDTFLGMVGHIIHAAETAFGWIPGLGGKLHDAADKFDEFRDNVNASLRGIEDRVVNVVVNYYDPGGPSGGRELGPGRTGVQLAEGGFVDKATMALIGEAGRELVLPLTDMRRTSQLLAQAGLLAPFASVSTGSAAARRSGGGFGGGGNTYILQILSTTGDIPDETIRKIRSQLFELENDVPSASIVPA